MWQVCVCVYIPADSWGRSVGVGIIKASILWLRGYFGKECNGRFLKTELKELRAGLSGDTLNLKTYAL